MSVLCNKLSIHFDLIELTQPWLHRGLTVSMTILCPKMSWGTIKEHRILHVKVIYSMRLKNPHMWRYTECGSHWAVLVCHQLSDAHVDM